MHTVALALEAAGKVLWVGLLLGAGLPALFALGVRSLAFGSGGDAEVHPAGQAPAAHPVGRLLAGICFGLVILAAALGILFIVASGFGKTLSFEHIYPLIVDKH
ncbi:MAG: hypothetical protein L0H26_01140 [Microlunatus sp.]|nr:hypothetical protein [Microlunatus sp.]